MVLLIAVFLFASLVFAAHYSGLVFTATEIAWKIAAAQIKTVTNNLIFSVVDCVLAILRIAKLAMAYFDKSMANLILHQLKSIFRSDVCLYSTKLYLEYFLDMKMGYRNCLLNFYGLK